MSESRKSVLFVCVENSNRSQMAEAFAHMHGAGDIEAYSAGSRPSGRVNPKAVEAMPEVGYDLTQRHSKSLSDIPPTEYDAVVGMGCGDEGCPLVRAKRREEWDIPDPKELPADPVSSGPRPDREEGQGTAALAVSNSPVSCG
jgi:protein-tyrosine-phosphatase